MREDSTRIGSLPFPGMARSPAGRPAAVQLRFVSSEIKALEAAWRDSGAIWRKDCSFSPAYSNPEMSLKDKVSGWG